MTDKQQATKELLFTIQSSAKMILQRLEYIVVFDDGSIDASEWEGIVLASGFIVDAIATFDEGEDK